MARPVAADTEIVRRFDQLFDEMMVPDAIDHDTGQPGNWIC
ncbi:MAG: hypothetical protein M2R45_03811 [Verrucomicrobia subdivision 3 bacterium]|nr:hypothetical protein [Limisphaerales bacterium]